MAAVTDASNATPDTGAVVAEIFRQHAGRLHAALARGLGAGNLALVEEAVSSAFEKALRGWVSGMPADPFAWLLRVARNRALDDLRAHARHLAKEEAVSYEIPTSAAAGTAGLRTELDDDLLAMLFVACHPVLPEASRLALALRTLCGLQTEEIARALLVGEAAIEKRLVRARRSLREANVRFDHPPPEELQERLDSVLRCVYLLFSEGYASHRGDELIRADLCREALRLGSLLASHPVTAAPRADALVALMALQASRLAARTDPATGELLNLQEQDRRRWNSDLIARGLAALSRSASGTEQSSYHLEAGIAAHHATAPSFEATNWSGIVGLYDQLDALTGGSPVVGLNRAIAVACGGAPDAALEELDALSADDSPLQDFALLHGARAFVLERLDRPDEAGAAYRIAAQHANTRSERRYILRRLNRLTLGAPG